jgi:hypothetical protein
MTVRLPNGDFATATEFLGVDHIDWKSKSGLALDRLSKRRVSSMRSTIELSKDHGCMVVTDPLPVYSRSLSTYLHLPFTPNMTYVPQPLDSILLRVCILLFCFWSLVEGKWHNTRYTFVRLLSLCCQVGATEITQTLIIPLQPIADVSSVSFLGIVSDGITPYLEVASGVAAYRYFEPYPDTTWIHMDLPC